MLKKLYEEELKIAEEKEMKLTAKKQSENMDAAQKKFWAAIPLKMSHEEIIKRIEAL